MLTLVKTITIKESVYKDLVKVKGTDESFSDLFERLLSQARAIDILTKLKGSMTFKNKSKMISEIYSKRSVWR